MLEKEIEKRLVQLVKKYDGLCYKFESPGNSGVPDRIVILPNGKIYFVELKTKEGSLRKIQQWQIGRILKCGANVRVLYGLQEVENFISEVVANDF